MVADTGNDIFWESRLIVTNLLGSRLYQLLSIFRSKNYIKYNIMIYRNTLFFLLFGFEKILTNKIFFVYAFAILSVFNYSYLFRSSASL